MKKESISLQEIYNKYQKERNMYIKQQQEI